MTSTENTRKKRQVGRGTPRLTLGRSCTRECGYTTRLSRTWRPRSRFSPWTSTVSPWRGPRTSSRPTEQSARRRLRMHSGTSRASGEKVEQKRGHGLPPKNAQVQWYTKDNQLMHRNASNGVGCSAIPFSRVCRGQPTCGMNASSAYNLLVE